MAETRLFEYGEHWLVRRTDTPCYYIYWCRPGTRRVLRKSTGRTDLEEAKRELIAFVERQRPHPTNGGTDASNAVSPLIGFPAAAAASSHSSPVLLDLLTSYVERLSTETRARAVALPSLRVLAEFLDRHDVVYAHELTLEVQERFVLWRQDRFKELGRGGSNATINRDLSVLKAALRDAWKRGKIPTAPYILSLPSPPPRPRFLDAEEAKRLIDACYELHLHRYVMLALHTLQRPSALLGLRVEQVDLARGRIDFLPANAVQSNKRRPIVPITPTLREELRWAIADSKCGFIVEWDGQPVHSIRKSFHGACRRAGLAGVTPYTLRHTGATLLAAQGVSMRQIAGMLGHSTQRTTERYAKHAPEFLQDAAAKLETLFGSPSTPICAPDARQPRASANDSQLAEAPHHVFDVMPSGSAANSGTAAEPQGFRGLQDEWGRPCQADSVLVEASFTPRSAGVAQG